MNDIEKHIAALHQGNKASLARCITIVENNLEGANHILQSLEFKRNVPVIGITGPPGAGKSTLVNALINELIKANPSAIIGIVAIDPTSAFNYGSILGDRIRMSYHFTNENVFIRSLATRGSLGGLSSKTIEVTDLMRASNFDYIIIETVGVGQSEVEIVGLADTTIVVLVPESGDEVQVIKSGIMEIADIFVVNKADRAGANTFIKNLQSIISHAPDQWITPVLKTIASKEEGIAELIVEIKKHLDLHVISMKRYQMLAQKVWNIIQQHRMKNINKEKILEKLIKQDKEHYINLYNFSEQYFIDRK